MDCLGKGHNNTGGANGLSSPYRILLFLANLGSRKSIQKYLPNRSETTRMLGILASYPNR